MKRRVFKIPMILLLALGSVVLGYYGCKKDRLDPNPKYNEAEAVKDEVPSFQRLFNTLVNEEINRANSYIHYVNGSRSADSLHKQLVKEMLVYKDSLPENNPLTNLDTIGYENLTALQFGNNLIGKWTFYSNATRDSLATATILLDRNTVSLTADFGDGQQTDVIALSPISAIIGGKFYIVNNGRIVNTNVTALSTKVD